MTAPAATLPVAAPGRGRGGHRRRSVLAELVIAAGICVTGFSFGTPWLRVREATWVVGALRLVGVRQVSGPLPGHILIFRADGGVLNAEVTASCSAMLSVVGLTALAVTVLRSRRLHALAGWLVAVVAVVVANDVRLALSTLAGLWWGERWLVLFHDWVGTLWSLAATLGGFLLMVWVTLPAAQRAEQDVGGRHIARRPNSWARPGLGYRMMLPEGGPGAGRRRSLTGLVHRYLLPGAVSQRLAAHREAGRIDYRIGHLPADERARTATRLAADGLGAHTASLLAIATYDRDPAVLDALADAVAARQWEPVTNQRVAALRLWAHGWLLRGTLDDADRPDREPPMEEPERGDEPPVTTTMRLPAPPPPPRSLLAPARRPPPPPPAPRTRPCLPPPRTFARRGTAAPAGTPTVRRRSFARPFPATPAPAPPTEDPR